MEDEKPKTSKWGIMRAVLFLILSFPFVVFREEIEAALAILLVIAALAIAWGSWQYDPDHWYWIAIPSIAVLIIAAWPIMKLADRIEARLDRGK